MLAILLFLIVLAPAAFSQEAVPVTFALEIKGPDAIRERLRLDLAAARAAMSAATLAADARQALQARAEALAAEVEALPREMPPGFRTIMPFSELQARIFALHAPVLRARGLPSLTAWVQNRWDPLFPVSEPPAGAPPPSLSVALMRGEHRGAALCLTNAGDAPQTVTCRLIGLPGGDDPAWIGVHEVLFTDTYVHYPIAAALPEARRAGTGYEVTIPAGMTRQVWFDLHPGDMPAGRYSGRVAVRAPGTPALTVPFSVHVYPLDFPAESSIALGGWDYTQGEKAERDAAVLDKGAFIRFLRAYGVNTPWAGGFRTGAQFDEAGNLTKAPDFSQWDAWVASWPGARYYATFGLSPDLAGPPPDSPVYRRRIAAWLGALVAHLKAQGLRPEQLAVLLVDEPRGPEFDAQFVPYAEAVRAADLGVTIWEDPCHEDPATADPRLYALTDVLCPSAARFVGSPQSYRDFFAAMRDAGKELWFYSCANGKHLDPITYHRGQFWLAAQYGARGSCYWAFGDEGGAGSSFAAYTSPWHMFSPLFLDRELGLYSGKHLEAIREGAEDFEYFVLLRQRVAALEARDVRSPVLDAARTLLRDGPARGTREITIDNLEWRVPKDREAMDRIRVEVLDALAGLAGL